MSSTASCEMSEDAPQVRNPDPLVWGSTTIHELMVTIGTNGTRQTEADTLVVN